MPKKDEGKVNADANGDSLLEQLPTELLQGSIAQYFSDADLCSLSQASITMFFTYRDSLAKTLLSHVVKGEEAEALKMIDAHPRLLLIPSKAIATDYSGRSYQGFTPFQGALLSHDFTLWRKMEPYFDKLPEGQAEKARQFKEIFPEGLPQQHHYDFNTLVQVISNTSDADIMTVLRKENNDTPICQAFNDFRATFTAIAMKETFFNPSHLIKALEVYINQSNTWSSHKRDLFWRQVVGYVQRFLPACYAQAILQGLYSIVEEIKPLERLLNYQFSSISYYPLTESSGLGFDFGIDYSLPEFLPRGIPPPGLRSAPGVACLINYVEQIQQNYLDLSIACGMTDNPSRAATI